MNNTFEFFNFNVQEFFLYSSVPERIESDLLKINWLRCIMRLHSNNVHTGGGFHCVTLLSDLFRLPGSDLNIDCGLYGHKVRIKPRIWNKVISFCYFCFLSIPLSFSVFALFIFVSTACKQIEKIIFHLVTVSNHISIA